MAKRIVSVTDGDWGQPGHRHVISLRFEQSMAGESVTTMLRHLARGHQYYVLVDGRRSEVDAWTCDQCGRATVRAYALGSWNDALTHLTTSP